MTRILVLGGAGAMASETTADLVETSDFSEIIVADIDLQKAESFVEKIGDRRVKAVKVDAENVDAMAGLMEGSNVVANGLPRTYAKKAIQAAIKAGVDMLDLISPHEDTLSLDAEARKRGISVVGGVGITPGVTNLLAQYGIDRLDQTDQIDIDFAAFRAIALSPGLLHVILWEFDPRTKERYYYDSGKLIPNPPFSGARVVEFPAPIGTQTTYYVPHGESQTLSKNTPGIKRVFIRGCFPSEAMAMVRAICEYGMYEAQPLKHDGVEISLYAALREYLLSSPQGGQTPTWGYSVQVEVAGQARGHSVLYRFVTSHPPMDKWGGSRAYAKNVGIPLSIGAQMVAQGKAKRKGVDGAEVMLPPADFVAEMRKRDFVINESMLYL